ncbi:MAG: hypothetical protein HC933_04410 [Pleurocapsa sp. SU_196_0]|nr:hypothetical protein [Pleurocapsa sp. SU_196_0]
MSEWNPVYQIETRVTVMGREPWELGALLAVLFVTNLSSREWAGALGSVVVAAVAVIVTSVLLKRLKQAIPPQAMVAYWRWFASSDVYLVERERFCKPLVLEGVGVHKPAEARGEP